MRFAPLPFRRQLRRNSTDAENAFWLILRDRRFADLKFRRQHPVGPYVLDFYCPSARLAIEIDGGQHFEAVAIRHDEARTRFLARHRITVVRFTDTDVLLQREAVLTELWHRLLSADPSP